MKLSLESKLALAKLLVSHGYNELDISRLYLKCSAPSCNCNKCKVHRICSHIAPGFLRDPYYIDNYPELFV